MAVEPTIERAYAAFARGQLNEAATAIQVVLARSPNLADANHLSGLIQAQLGRFAEARVLLERAALLAPGNAFVHSNLAMVLRELRLTDAALIAARRALSLDPQLSDAHNNLANALSDHGEQALALAHYRQALALAPDNMLFLKNLCTALLQAGDIEGAEILCCAELRRAPGSVAALAGRGEVAMYRKQWQAAHDWFTQALLRNDRDPRLVNSLGLALQELKRYSEAHAQFKHALEIDPGNADAWYNLGYLLEYRENQPAALPAYTKAYDLGLRHPRVKVMLLSALVAQRQVARAHALALTLLPEAQSNTRLFPPLLQTFGLACDFERLQDTWNRFDTALAQGAINQHSLEIVLLLGSYPDFIAENQLLAYHRAWGKGMEAEISPQQLPAVRSNTERLRVGYLSPDFRLHSVGFFIQHILAQHDRNRFEIFCYSNTRVRDEVTEFIEQHVDHFLAVRELDDDELAARIRTDAIDILIDLAGHSCNHRLPVMARRPAPLQLTWIGYLHTTGLAAVDYRITDPFADPETGDSGSERLLRLAHAFLCFGHFPQVPVEHEPPCQRNGYVTFASFNNLLKLNRSVLRTWARILTRVSGARLVVMAEGAEADLVRQHLTAEFARLGIAADRISVRAALPPLDYLRMHNDVDLLLDTFPFNGGTVTALSLWMGVPVVTLVGPVHRQRVSYSMLKNIGIEDGIAWSEDEYVDCGAALVADPQRLGELRRRIHQAVRASILCDPLRFTRELEMSLQAAWRAKVLPPS